MQGPSNSARDTVDTDTFHPHDGAGAEDPEQPSGHMALPAPDEVGGARPLLHGQGVPLDFLGPVVVAEDGSLSRIANWANLTDAEREVRPRWRNSST